MKGGKEKIPNAADNLHCTVVYATSEDPPFPAHELSKPIGKATRGWHSAKLGGFPQELGFRFDGEVQLTHLQILSHECMIPTKVEVFVAPLMDGVDISNPPGYDEVHFTKLGFLTFISNEKSKFRARERKTVNLSARAYFLKLVLHKCYSNQLNVYNQVGILKVDCYGQMLLPMAAHQPSPPRIPAPRGNENQLPPLQGRGQPQQQPQRDPMYEPAEEWRQPQPGAAYQPAPSSRMPLAHHQYPQGNVLPPIRQYQPQPPAAYYPPQMPPQMAAAPEGMFRSRPIIMFEQYFLRATRELVDRKSVAVEQEDFDTAKECKEKLLQLQDLSDKIYELESIKVKGIYDENFDTAKSAKAKMDRLCESAYELNSSIAPIPVKSKLQSSANPYAYPISDPNSPTPHGGVEEDEDYAAQQPQRNAGNVRKHAFEDQPVQSAYAQAMAEQARQKQQQQQVGESTHDESSPTGGGSPAKAKAKPAPKPKSGEDEENEEQEQEEEEAEEADDQDGEEEEEEEEGDDDAEEDPAPRKKPSNKENQKQKPSHAHPSKPGKEKNHPPRDEQQPSHAEGSGGPTPIPVRHFDINQFEEWERIVFTAIHKEANGGGGGSEEPMADPVDSADETLITEMTNTLGAYTTACLFCKRFRLREAALVVLTKYISQYYKLASTPQAVEPLLKYLDLKGYGLLDPIVNVFLAACSFLMALVGDHISDCPLSAVQIHVANLLPRLLLRAGDSTQKTREEAVAMIVRIASSSIGPERVSLAIVADPVDAEKRKLPPQNYRVHVSRLLVMKQLLQEHDLMVKGQTFDVIMNRLLVPCLNHLSKEVRDLALSVLECFDSDHQQDVMRYIHLISSGATRAAIQEQLAQPPPDSEVVEKRRPPKKPRHPKADRTAPSDAT